MINILKVLGEYRTDDSMPVRKMVEKRKMYVHEFALKKGGQEYTLRIFSEKSPSAFTRSDFEKMLRAASVFDSEGRRLSGFDRKNVLDDIERGGLQARRIEEEIKYKVSAEKVGERKFRGKVVFTPPKPKTVRIKAKPKPSARKTTEFKPKIPEWAKGPVKKKKRKEKKA